MELRHKNERFLKVAGEDEIKILKEVSGDKLDLIINITDFEKAVKRYRDRKKREEALKNIAPKVKARKQSIKYIVDCENLTSEYMENGINFFNRKLQDKGSKVARQLNTPRDAGTLVLNRTYKRLTDKLEEIQDLQNNGGSTLEIFKKIQEYYKLCYTGCLDSIGSYTLYLLLVYTNISLPEARNLTGATIEGIPYGIDKGGLSKIRSGKRWESLHEEGFLTEEEKAEAIKDFREIAPLVASKYDLEMIEPQEIRKN